MPGDRPLRDDKDACKAERMAIARRSRPPRRRAASGLRRQRRHLHRQAKAVYAKTSHHAQEIADIDDACNYVFQGSAEVAKTARSSTTASARAHLRQGVLRQGDENSGDCAATRARSARTGKYCTPNRRDLSARPSGRAAACDATKPPCLETLHCQAGPAAIASRWAALAVPRRLRGAAPYCSGNNVRSGPVVRGRIAVVRRLRRRQQHRHRRQRRRQRRHGGGGGGGGGGAGAAAVAAAAAAARRQRRRRHWWQRQRRRGGRRRRQRRRRHRRPAVSVAPAGRPAPAAAAAGTRVDAPT